MELGDFLNETLVKDKFNCERGLTQYDKFSLIVGQLSDASP